LPTGTRPPVSPAPLPGATRTVAPLPLPSTSNKFSTKTSAPTHSTPVVGKKIDVKELKNDNKSLIPPPPPPPPKRKK
jgi:hypothetical protein